MKSIDESMSCRRRTHGIAVVLAAIVLAVAATACSRGDEGPPASPAIMQAIKARQSNYKEIGGAFKTLSDELKSGAPDINSLGPAAAEIVARGGNQLQYFPPGSGPESHQKTRAKPAVWADFTTFTQAHQKFISNAQQMLQALQSGADRSKLAQLHAALGESCKSCHSRFRVPD